MVTGFSRVQPKVVEDLPDMYHGGGYETEPDLPPMRQEFMVVNFSGADELERYLNQQDGWAVYQILERRGLIILERWVRIDQESTETDSKG